MESRPPQVLFVQTEESHFSVLNPKTSICDFQSSSLHHNRIGRSGCSFSLGSRTSRLPEVFLFTFRPNRFNCFRASTVGIAIHMYSSFTANCMSIRSCTRALRGVSDSSCNVSNVWRNPGANFVRTLVLLRTTLPCAPKLQPVVPSAPNCPPFFDSDVDEQRPFECCALDCSKESFSNRSSRKTQFD